MPPEPEVALQKLGRQRYVVCVDGYLETGWQARLATGLASARLNIIEGFSASDGFGKWRGEFEFDSTQGVDPESLDLLALMKSTTALTDGAIEIDEARVAEAAAYGGSVLLSVAGLDSIGFLSRLLSACQSFGLFPVELRLRTRNGKLDDLLYLKDAKWAPPSPHAETALRTWLETRLANRR